MLARLVVAAPPGAIRRTFRTTTSERQASWAPVSMCISMGSALLAPVPTLLLPTPLASVMISGGRAWQVGCPSRALRAGRAPKSVDRGEGAQREGGRGGGGGGRGGGGKKRTWTRRERPGPSSLGLRLAPTAICTPAARRAPAWSGPKCPDCSSDPAAPLVGGPGCCRRRRHTKRRRRRRRRRRGRRRRHRRRRRRHHHRCS